MYFHRRVMSVLHMHAPGLCSATVLQIVVSTLRFWQHANGLTDTLLNCGKNPKKSYMLVWRLGRGDEAKLHSLFVDAWHGLHMSSDTMACTGM